MAAESGSADCEGHVCEKCGGEFDTKRTLSVHQIHPCGDEKREKLLGELTDLADELGRRPTYDDAGKYESSAAETYSNEFGSWNEALQEAGLGVNDRVNIPREELLEEIHRLSDSTGRTPKLDDLEKDGEFAHTAYYRVFGSWNEALKEAGFELNNRSGIPRGELLEELRRVGTSMDSTPSLQDIDQEGKFSSGTYKRSFGTWNAALAAAGFEVNKEHGIEPEKLLADIERVAEELERPPSANEINVLGEYDPGTYYNHFESWNAALEEAGYRTYWDRFTPVESSRFSYGSTWDDQRDKRREIDGHQCVVCSMGEALHEEVFGQKHPVHHITPAQTFLDDDGELDEERAHRIENLRTMCSTCHARWEGIPVAPAEPQ